MATLSEKPDPPAVEREIRALWSAQGLPPSSTPLGPAEGPVVRQFLGAFAAQEAGTLVAQRTLAADVDARAMALAGRRSKAILRKEDGGPATATPKMAPVLAALGIWVGGSEGHPWDELPRRSEVQTLVGRLAHMGALAVRDVSLRICPACAMARSPERIVYQEEDGETLLVRFPFPDADRPVSALVWTDAPWRLLGTSALMVHPDVPYVIARYQRKGGDELVFTSKSSLDRLRGWLPGAEFEVLEEHPGRHWEGRAYIHPLRHEFPLGGSLEPPGGTILSVTDVSDSGTGVVPLVPGHGGTDTQIADRLNVPGWPLITPKGRFDILWVHKYAGLELESGSEFVIRDLDEEGAIFARLRVRRGVPHCSRCGTALIWAPARAWCLEPSRLPAERVALYRSLLPNDRPIEKLEAVPWPVSEPQRTDDPLAISLLECTSCDRLEAPENGGERCVCGGRRRVVRRRLLQAFDAAAASWASVDPFPSADTTRLYVNERRRAPAVVHQIAAMSGVGGTIGDVRLTLLPTVPNLDLLPLIATHGADAVRAALVRAQGSEGATATFEERCAQEARRLGSFWRTAGKVLSSVDPGALSAYAQPIGGSLGELEPEDRALLARLERLRIQCEVDYDRSSPDLVHRHLFQFLENDFSAYRQWVAPRVALVGTPPSKRAAIHTLVHTLFGATQLLGPIAPYTSEAVHRALRRSRASLFQETAAGVDRALLDPARAKAWDRWVSVVRALERFRRRAGLLATALLPSVALVLDSDAVAADFRAEAPTLERLARVGRLEIGSPSAPWAGRRRQLRPRESEIQRVYASRAAQIIHLLRRMPERKSTDRESGPGFTMIVNGQPTQILPSMVAWEETLPDRVVAVDWPMGELYAELPAGSENQPTRPPPLSPDAFRVVSRIRQRVRSSPASASPVVILAAPPALAAELSSVSGPVANYLGLSELRIIASDRELPAHGRGFGRTKAGASWAFHVSDRSTKVRPRKLRRARSDGGRVRRAFAPGDLAPTVRNYADDDVLSRETAVRALGEELDQILGSPLLGPTKVGGAWDAGLRSVDAFREAPWEALVALPGFGVPIASALVTKFGGTVPPRPARPPRSSASRLAVGGETRIPHDFPQPFERGVPLPVGPPTLDSDSSVPADFQTEPPRLPAPPESSPTGSGGEIPQVSEAPLVELPPEGSTPGMVSEPNPDWEDPTLPAPPQTPRGEVANSIPAPPEAPALPPLLATDADVGADSAPALPGLEPLENPTPTTPTESPDLTDPASMQLADPEAMPALTDPSTVLPPESGTPDLLAPSAIPTPADATDSAEPSSPNVSEELVATEGAVPSTADGVPPTAPVPDELELASPATTPPQNFVPTEAGPEVDTGPLRNTVSISSPPPSGPTPELSLTPKPPAPTLPPAESIAESLGFPPIGAALPSTPPELALAPPPPAAPAGGIDLAVGPSYFPSLERFLEATAAGHQGICVVRDSPERVRSYVGSRPVEIRWLTNIGRGPTLKPTDLEGFSAFLTHAVSSGHVTAFFLEGVEYLVRLHGLDKVVERLVDFDRLAREHSARVWLPLNQKLLSLPELDRFVATFGGGPVAP